MPLLQPWYQERGKAIHIATYKDEKVMKREVEEAAKYGWKPENSAATAGHINVGRTVAPAVLTGGLSLLLGASRSKDKMTITFVRDERALAREAVEDALGHFSSCQTRLQKVTADEASEHGEMETHVQEPRAGGQGHEKTGRNLHLRPLDNWSTDSRTSSDILKR